MAGGPDKAMFQLKRQGMLIVVSSPSGGGKSTVIREVMKQDPRLEYSVSVTSRSPRPGEVNGESYHFVTEEDFRAWINRGVFYEWAVVHDNLYGTRRDIVEERLRRGHDVIMDLDFQGGLNIKKQAPASVLVFILPPSMTVLEERLRDRKTDSEETIRLRLHNALEEIRHATQYDYVLINEELDATIKQVKGIIAAEHHRAARLTIEMNNGGDPA